MDVAVSRKILDPFPLLLYGQDSFLRLTGDLGLVPHVLFVHTLVKRRTRGHGDGGRYILSRDHILVIY